MNRNSEYEELLRELDDVRVPEDCVEKAMRRAKRSRYTLRTLSGIAAAFALFVILVNASTTVASGKAGMFIPKPRFDDITMPPFVATSASHSVAPSGYCFERSQVQQFDIPIWPKNDVTFSLAQPIIMLSYLCCISSMRARMSFSSRQ